ncbi:MAG: nucleoside triphosphate pyrophosphohydrolase family protein [Ekhidna sp.]|nr:nucleoside triphosphate pyrophosphohydrolase family protein [Ekhidna sp.]MBC6409365.1 nucleoside triphosphate pyrophosphohydrolase family protein [Ekhidna sp.]MBC6426843.1 nucleoside triphosphate pyrophosphohydrolase family protein [Ekhidna sp.]
MDKIDPLNQVAAFHTTFRHPILEKPQIPSAARCELRIALIAEELEELKEAIKNKDLLEVADALCDIQYVLSGAVLEFGLGEQFKALFEEVQRSNMSKACDSKEEAEETVAYYKSEKNMDAYYEERDGKWLVYRTGDNKTLKSINYSPADLRRILG